MKHTGLAVGAMILCVGLIGTTELIVTGALPGLASDLQVTVASTGLLVAIYAFAVAVGGPVISALTIKCDRRTLLIVLMSVFTLGNLLCTVGGQYPEVALGRVISALTKGTILASAALITVSLVNINKTGRSLATLSVGMNLATAAGTPIGVAIAAEYGWPVIFLILAILGVMFASLVILTVPRVPAPAGTSLRSDIQGLTDPPVLQSIGVTVLAQAGLFSAITYLAPILTSRSFHGRWWAVLLIFGLACAAGNVVSGCLADWRPFGPLLTMICLLAASLAELSLCTTAVQMTFWLAAVGFFGFGMSPGLQTMILRQCGPAQTLALTFSVSAFNAGNGFGALLGSMLLTLGMPISDIPLIGAIVTLAGAAALSLGSRSVDDHRTGASHRDDTETTADKPSA